MQRILVVEDEMQIARIVRDYLEVAGFDVTVVGDGEAALASARGDRPDLVVLDLGLPGMDGLDVARELRRTSTAPIVMLTARGEEIGPHRRSRARRRRLRGQAVQPEGAGGARPRGAPPHERRDGRSAESCAPATSRSTCRGCASRVGRRPVELTPTEFQLLATLVREPGRVFTRGQLLDAIHGVAFESYERAIDAHVKNLRRKIEPEPGTPAIRADGPRRRLPVRRCLSTTDARGAPWRDPDWDGPPPWAGRGPGFGAGRRFRRGAIAVLVLVVLLVAALATVRRRPARRRQRTARRS